MGPNGSGKSTLAQVLAGHPAYEVTGGHGDLRRRGPARAGARGARPDGRLPRVPVSGRDPGRDQRLLPARGVQRAAQGARPGGGRPDRVPGHRGENAQARRHGSGDAEPLRQRRVLRRREEAQRDPADGGARAAGSRFSTRPTRGSTSTRCASWPTASTRSAGPTTRRSSSRTTSGCSTTSSRLRARARRAAGSCKSGGKELALELEAKGYDWLVDASAAWRGRARDAFRAYVDDVRRRSPAAADAMPDWLRAAAARGDRPVSRARVPDARRRGLAFHERRADRRQRVRAARRRDAATLAAAADLAPFLFGGADWHTARVRERTVRAGAVVDPASASAPAFEVTQLSRAALGDDRAGVARASDARWRALEHNAFTALNTAFVHGRRVRPRAARDATSTRPIHLLFVTDADAADGVAHPRNAHRRRAATRRRRWSRATSRSGDATVLHQRGHRSRASATARA